MRHLACCIVLLCTIITSYCQDSSTARISTQYLPSIAHTSARLERQLTQRSAKALRQLDQQEARIKRRLMKLDSTKANQLFGQTREKLGKAINGQPYIPSLDTLATSLQFLHQNPQLLAATKEAKEKLAAAVTSINGLKDQFQKAATIQQYLKERKEYLKQQLSSFGFGKQLTQLNKQAYYYGEQLKEYKAVLKDHKKAERKALELLSKTRLFQNFMRKNSQLASLFRLPDPNNPATMASLAGLQTRAQVNGLVQQQLAAGGPNASTQFRQNMQQAQAQLSELKNKMLKLGSSSSDAVLPEGFKPNSQKTKSFGKRLQYGSNIQSQKATNYFPVTTDLGLSIGYQLNDRSVIGIGASYKIGMGSGWNHLRFSSQGMGLRSFIDWKLKGSLWLSGGYERNYRPAFNSIAQLKDRSAWQQSGLIGVSKVLALKTKFFKQTKLQLLWDVLSYEQVPKTQPVVFRIGYNMGK